MGRRILIADDEELERRGIRQFLERIPGLDILEAENGLQVLELAAQAPVAVALLDIKMPGLDGIAAAESLRSLHPDIAIVFLTAYDQFDYARSALRLRVDEFLLKPASAEEVVTTVRRLLDRIVRRDDERELSQAALVRLDGAIHLVAGRLRQDLSEGLPDLDLIGRYADLHGLTDRHLTVMEARPAGSAAGLSHAVSLAEAWFGPGEAEALASVRGAVLRILLIGAPERTGEQLLSQVRGFRDRVRTELGCGLLVGVAVATGAGVHPDALMAAAHRAAAIAGPSNPVLVVPVGPDPTGIRALRVGAAACLPVPVIRALEILEARMAEDLSLNTVAASVGLSPSHLSRQLARATGNGFAECLALVRIGAAKRYLADGALTVKEVARLVGFHDPAYFARVFRRVEGRSPAEFRLRSETPEAGE